MTEFMMLWAYAVYIFVAATAASSAAAGIRAFLPIRHAASEARLC